MYVLRTPTLVAHAVAPHMTPAERPDFLPDGRTGWSRATYSSKAAALKASNAVVRTWRHYERPGSRAMTGNSGRTAKRDFGYIRDTGAIDKWDLYTRKVRGACYVGSIEVVVDA